MDYKQTTQTLTTWRRSGLMNIHNPLSDSGEPPSITFQEQDCVRMPDGKIIVSNVTAENNTLRVVFDPTKTIDLLNPLDGSPLGMTARHQDFFVLLYSIYMEAASERDARLVAEAAEKAAAAQAAAFAAANPVPILTFAHPSGGNVVMGGEYKNVASSDHMGGNYGKITYSSDDETIAMVDEAGTVIPVSVGSTIIRATQQPAINANSTGHATYNINVVMTPMPSIHWLNPGPYNLTVGQTDHNSVLSNMHGDPYGAITFESSNPDTVTIDNSGTMVAQQVGSVKITATQAAVAGVNTEATCSFDVVVSAKVTG